MQVILVGADEKDTPRLYGGKRNRQDPIASFASFRPVLFNA
jgi:hypothetical protein